MVKRYFMGNYSRITVKLPTYSKKKPYNEMQTVSYISCTNMFNLDVNDNQYT